MSQNLLIALCDSPLNGKSVAIPTALVMKLYASSHGSLFDETKDFFCFGFKTSV